MVRFMIYLLETGICLSLLYLAYWLFLRKETYFNFNRLFLVGSIVLALLVPLLHLNLDIPRGSVLENPARGISSFRTTYEELISLLDADFGTEPGDEHMLTKGPVSAVAGQEQGTIPREGTHGKQWESVHVASGEAHEPERGKTSVSKILLFIYIGGVLYFLARFIYLVIRLYLLAKRNGVTRQDGFRVVEIKEEISPFSFFRYLFINNKSFDDSELHHVLEHEKAHIRQRHTTDHLFAHGLAVFQWFNPFAWQVRKALKTTHEYIADRQVIDKGFERFDYQALLLKQVIGYHSVELVNNFNLKPIKKRIAMMNKTKSGLSAKLKAMLVAPFAIFIFILFADFTLKGNHNETQAVSIDLQGLWIAQAGDEFSPSLYINEGRFSYTEGVKIRDFHMRVEQGKIYLLTAPGPETPLRFELKQDQLILWWNDARSSMYMRSKAKNTLDQLMLDYGVQLDLPAISQYRLLEDEFRLYRLCMGMKANGEISLVFDGELITIDMLADRVNRKRLELNKIDQPYLTALFLVDRKVPMDALVKVREVLRKIEALHIAEGGYPQGDLNLSPLIYDAVALPRLLPPLNAKVLDRKEVEKFGTGLYTIDLSARNTSPRDADEGLRDFIRDQSNGKYVISLEYDGVIPYGQYVESVDMVWRTVYGFRNRLALDRYNVPYDNLGDKVQKEIRKVYPMALAEFMKK